MPSFLKKKQFWGALIACGILAFLLYDLDRTRTVEIIAGLRLGYLIPALICGGLIIFFKSLRWITIVSKVRRVLFWPTLSLYSTAQIIAVVLPALTGQAGRVLLFSKKGDFSKTYAFSTIFLEIVLDGAGLIGLMIINSSVFVFPRDYRFISYIIGGATLLLLIVFYASLHFQTNLERFGYHHLHPRWPRLFLVLRKFIRSFNDGISVLKSTDKLLIVSILTALAWLSYIGAVFFLFKAFRFTLPFSAAMVVIIINYLALMIPITPGNLGSFQLAVVAALNIFSVPKTEGLLLSMILYAVDMLPMMALSIPFTFKEHFSISEISEDRELMAEVEKIVSDPQLPVEGKRP